MAQMTSKHYINVAKRHFALFLMVFVPVLLIWILFRRDKTIPFYSTDTFYFLVAVFFGVIGAITYAYRLGTVMRREEEIFDIVESKTKELQLEIEHLREAAKGYVTLDIPEEQKPMFIDLLRGFEEFSAIKGFPIAFSLENSKANKISFKMNIRSEVIRSLKQVETDWKEYINKVGKGDELNDLPMVLPFAQHNSLLLAMRNRISFLTHTYTAQKNVIEFYKQALSELPKLIASAGPSQTFYVQDAATVDLARYSSVNSTQVAQGRSNKVSENTATIRIGATARERYEQAKTIDKLVALLQTEVAESKQANEAVRVLLNVKDELTEDKPAEPSRVQKWLETAKASLQTLSLGNDTTEALKAVWEAFKLG